MAEGKLYNPYTIEYISDCNNAKSSSKRYKTGTDTLNTPKSGYFIISIIDYTPLNNIVQIAAETNTAEVFVRAFHDNTTWTSWKRVSDNVKSLTLTAETGCTIIDNSSYQSGNIVCVSLTIDVTTAPSDTTHLIKGFPRPPVTIFTILNRHNGTGQSIALTTGGIIRNNWGAITTGRYNLNFSYITND